VTKEWQTVQGIRFRHRSLRPGWCFVNTGVPDGTDPAQRDGADVRPAPVDPLAKVNELRESLTAAPPHSRPDLGDDEHVHLMYPRDDNYSIIASTA
jgi:hypothetical protein